MRNELASYLVLAWFPIALALVWALGARRAAPIAIVGAYLFLPEFLHWDFLRPLMIEKRTVIGPAFLLAALVFDRRTLLRCRPSWIDLPMAAFVAVPLIGLAWHRFDEVGASIDQSWLILTEWAVPYAIARVYLGDADGPLRLAVAIAIGGLIYIPICLYESTFGPDYYLARILYAFQYNGTSLVRLGGYRPVGFLGNGIDLATWMALATVMAGWLWLSSSGGRLFGLPRWSWGIATLALVATTLICRGVFGYIAMALGLVATVATLVLRTKAPLALLLLIPPAYIVARSTGMWDGGPMRDVARRAGKEGTIGVRLAMEDQFVRETMGRDILLGFGGRAPYWTADGWWVVELKAEGVVGLVAMLTAFLLPAALVVCSSRRRFPPRSVEVGLALVALLIEIHSLHNTSWYAVLPVIGGTLVGSWLAGGPTARPASKPPSRPAGRP